MQAARQCIELPRLLPYSELVCFKNFATLVSPPVCTEKANTGVISERREIFMHQNKARMEALRAYARDCIYLKHPRKSRNKKRETLFDQQICMHNLIGHYHFSHPGVKKYDALKKEEVPEE